jgi:hypothetical protein
LSQVVFSGVANSLCINIYTIYVTIYTKDKRIYDILHLVPTRIVSTLFILELRFFT